MDEGLGKVIKVKDLRGMLKDLDDDFDVVFTARKRISKEEMYHSGYPVPYHFVGVTPHLEDINKKYKEIHFEFEIPSEFYYLDN